jgi:hypothetical protein
MLIGRRGDQSQCAHRIRLSQHRPSRSSASGGAVDSYGHHGSQERTRFWVGEF